MAKFQYQVIKVDKNLSAGQRTRLGLGPIETDPRDAALNLSFARVGEEGVEAISDPVWLPFEKAAITSQEDIETLIEPMLAAAAASWRAARRRPWNINELEGRAFTLDI